MRNRHSRAEPGDWKCTENISNAEIGVIYRTRAVNILGVRASCPGPARLQANVRNFTKTAYSSLCPSCHYSYFCCFLFDKLKYLFCWLFFINKCFSYLQVQVMLNWASHSTYFQYVPGLPWDKWPECNSWVWELITFFGMLWLWFKVFFFNLSLAHFVLLLFWCISELLLKRGSLHRIKPLFSFLKFWLIDMCSLSVLKEIMLTGGGSGKAILLFGAVKVL